MTDEKKVAPARNDGRKVLMYLAVAGIAAFVLWTVFKTEMRVRDLVVRGFTDVAIDSVRNHAYAPMIGSLIGAAIMVGIVVLAKRMMRR